MFSSARRDGNFCYMGYFPRKNFSVCNVPDSLLVYIIGSSGRIRSTTGTWAEPLFSMPNLMDDVPLNGSGDYIERGEHKVGQGGCAACMLVTSVLVKHILRMLLLAQMTFANNQHPKMHMLQNLIVLPTCMPIKCTLQCIQRGSAGLTNVHANQSTGNLSRSSSVQHHRIACNHVGAD
jgi:hypothetical protein